MKRLLFISLIAFMQTAAAFSQTQADDITGYYLATDPKTGDKLQMEIYKTPEAKYEIKVVWVENPAASSHVGTVQFRNLTYDPKNREWINGKVMYDGSEYSTKISFSEPGKLKVRGYLGISLLGKSVYWTKEKELRK